MTEDTYIYIYKLNGKGRNFMGDTHLLHLLKYQQNNPNLTISRSLYLFVLHLLFLISDLLKHTYSAMNLNIVVVRPVLCGHMRTKGVGRGGGGGGGDSPPNNLRWGGQHTLWPPNNPPTFSFNFYVKPEKNTNVRN